MIKGPDTPHWHGRRSSVEAHCCVASCLLRPAKKLHLITPETTAKDYDQQALTFCACMKGDASLRICKLLIWLSSIYDAALANIAVSMSDKKRQRRKKRRNFFALIRFTWTASQWFSHRCSVGPKNRQGPISWMFVSKLPDRMTACVECIYWPHDGHPCQFRRVSSPPGAFSGNEYNQ